jgi:hypothetical protein
MNLEVHENALIFLQSVNGAQKSQTTDGLLLCRLYRQRRSFELWLVFFFQVSPAAMPSTFGEKLREEVRDIEIKMKKTITRANLERAPP